MKKRILAVILSLCVLFAMSTVAMAAESVSVDTEIIATKRFCPGDYIVAETIEAPSFSGPVFVSGWEVKMPGSSDWIPYQGEALTEEYDGALLHYYVRSFDNDTAYSNECTLIVKHNPTGEYLYSGTDHWRVCADCGEPAGEELHTFFGAADSNSGKGTICEICGAHRTSQWTGLVSFFEWVFQLIASLIS